MNIHITKTAFAFALAMVPSFVGAQNEIKNTALDQEMNVPLPPPGPYVSVRNPGRNPMPIPMPNPGSDSMSKPENGMPSSAPALVNNPSKPNLNLGEFPPADFDPEANEKTLPKEDQPPVANVETSDPATSTKAKVNTSIAPLPTYAPANTGVLTPEPSGASTPNSPNAMLNNPAPATAPATATAPKTTYAPADTATVPQLNRPALNSGQSQNTISPNANNYAPLAPAQPNNPFPQNSARPNQPAPQYPPANSQSRNQVPPPGQAGTYWQGAPNLQNFRQNPAQNTNQYPLQYPNQNVMQGQHQGQMQNPYPPRFQQNPQSANSQTRYQNQWGLGRAPQQNFNTQTGQNWNGAPPQQFWGSNQAPGFQNFTPNFNPNSQTINPQYAPRRNSNTPNNRNGGT